MDKKRLFFLVLLFVFLMVTCGWPVKSQVITEKFDKMVLSENFDTLNEYWSTVANSENLFLVQEGEYILNRRSLTAPYAILAGYQSSLQNFRLVTSLNLERTVSDNGSLGIIIMAQPGGNGGFLIEINTQKQYRVRQIAGNSYRYLSGDPKKGGWAYSRVINNVNSYNLIDVRVFNRNYDLYINNNFIMSFSEMAYKSGNFGFIIGPGSKGRIDFLYVFTLSDHLADKQSKNVESQSAEFSGSTPDIIELAESIIQLKTQINKLKEQNEDMRKTLQAMKVEEAEKEARLNERDKTIKELRAALTRQQAQYDSLLKVNQSLIKFKELAGGNENTDLIISLSKSLKAEKELNEKLKKEIKLLNDSLQSLRQSRRPPDGREPAQDAPRTKPSTNFSLPVEN
jgi:outer membrane murein-binding lipoprotein Lpp